MVGMSFWDKNFDARHEDQAANVRWLICRRDEKVDSGSAQHHCARVREFLDCPRRVCMSNPTIVPLESR
jgi:hypothetical protein